MPENRSLFVLACQQVTAVALVGVVAASAVGVVELEIVPPVGEAPAMTLGPGRSVVSDAPVEPEVHAVPLTDDKQRSERPSESGTDRRSPQENQVVSKPEPVRGFATVGVTWDDTAALEEDQIVVSVRTLTDGSWSPWQEMHYDADHGPDPGEASERVREGTDAVVVGAVDDVQVRARTTTGDVPKGLELAIVDPGADRTPVEQEPEIDTGRPSGALAGDLMLSAGVSAPRPQIYSRAQWGADERLRDPGSLRYGEIHAGFVHHTVNANDYSRAEVPAILRGIYAYHTRSRGWSDVGYNFLVDRFGRIWEGRYGGVARPVVGAHTLGYNEDSFAMSAIGNFETARPSEAMLDAYGALMGWKLGLHGIDANDTRQFVTSRTFQAINGHRDAGSTACPGRNLYERLPAIRRRAGEAQDGRTPPEPEPEPEPPAPTTGTPLDADLSGNSWPDLVVRDAVTKHALIVRTGGQTSFLDGIDGGGGWSETDLVGAGDFDGDGITDLVGRSAATKEARLSVGDGTGALVPTRTYDRFRGLDQLTGVGDFDGDGHADLVGRRARTGDLVLYPGAGDGSFGAVRVLSTDWSGYDLTTGVGDLDGDDRADLVARTGDTLSLLSGRGDRLAAPVALPGESWSDVDVLSGGGDATGDGAPDLVARVRASGMTYLYPGDGAGSLGARMGGWPQYDGLDWLVLAGQLTGSRHADLAGASAGSARVTVFAHSGRRNLGATIDTGTVLDGIDLLLNVGDWNGDGRGDVMTRDADTGTLHFRAGLRRNRLAAPVVAARDWGAITVVAAVGDVTGDGKPDLVGRGARGAHRVYAGDGSTGIADNYVAHDPVAGVDRLALGRWDGDKVPDVALRRTDGSLWVRSTDSGENTQVGDRLRRYDWVRGLGDLDGDGRADVVVRTRASGSLYLLPGRSNGFGPRRLISTGFGRYDLSG